VIRWLLLALVVTGCARPVRTAGTPRPVTDATVRAVVDSLVAAPAWRRAQVGIVVAEVASGRVIAQHNADALLIPASNQKLVTAAVALTALGPDFRFHTVLGADAPIRDGVLEGDLVVVGSGDPSYSDRVRGSARAALDSLATALQQRGIRHIRGTLRAGPSVFVDAPLGSGWAWDDLGAAYSAAVGDLMYEDRYAAAQVLVGSDSLTRARSSDRVAFLDALAAVLTARGMLGADSVASTRSGTPPADTLVLAASPPLAQLLPHFLKPSQNQHGELWLKTLGRVHTGVGRADSGRVVVARQLAAWGIDPDAVIVRDGSGLSRHNLLTPAALVTLLRVMAVSPHADLYRNALPLAGTDGTLAQRLRGTAAAGRVAAKTGSLDRVRALSGYVTDARGRELIVVGLFNHFPGSATDAMTALDHLAATVAASTGPGRAR